MKIRLELEIQYCYSVSYNEKHKDLSGQMYYY